MRSENDDLVMSFAIGCWIKDTVFVENKRKVEHHKACLNSMFKSDSIMNTTIPGMTGYKPTKKTDDIKKQLDHMWLLKG